LSHIFGLFSYGYFEDRTLLFAQTGLVCATPILRFLPLLELQAQATKPSFFSIDLGSHELFFLPGLA
jgi:hypothetical protein